MSARVTALLCPRCGGPLRGLQFDVAFVCRPCAIGVVFEAATPSLHTLRFARPLVAEPPQLALPVWRISGSWECSAGSDEQRQVSERLLRDRPVYVTGFQASHGQAFGDLGLKLTQTTARLEEDASPVPNLPFGGVTRSPAGAIQLAQLEALLLVDQRCDVTGMTLRLTGPTVELWALPCARQEMRIVDLVLGSSVPCFAIDDLEELLRTP